MPVVFTGLMTMVAAQLFDLSTFLAMLRRVGPAAETNPFVVDTLTNHGLPILVIGKLVVVGFVAALTVVLIHSQRPSQARIAALVVAISIVAGLVGGGSNALVLRTL